MRKYEIMYIIPSKYTEGEMDEIIKKIAEIMTTAGAQISDTFNMGKRRLAYPVDHQRNGTYVLVHFEAESPVLAKMDLVLRMTGEVLRHMIVERDLSLKMPPTFNETEERRSDESRERQKEAPLIQAKSLPSSAQNESVDIQELDKKLDEILTEEVL
ncbi:MAG: 30S ribosomal protein S6 [Patescibacteria group bacterium]